MKNGLTIFIIVTSLSILFMILGCEPETTILSALLVFFFFFLSHQSTHAKPALELTDVILMILAYAMYIDQKETKSELNVVKKYILKISYKNKALATTRLQTLKQYLKERKFHQMNFSEYCNVIAQELNYQQRKELLSVLFEICAVDNVIEESEEKLLHEFAKHTGISRSDYENEQAKRHIHKPSQSNNQHHSLPMDSILLLLAYTMKVDKKETKNELSVVKRYILKISNGDETLAKTKLQILKQYMELSIHQMNFPEYCNEIAQTLNFNQKLELLWLLFEICAADDKIETCEDNLLRLFLRHTKINQVYYERAKAYYMNAYLWYKNDQYQQEYKRKAEEKGQQTKATSSHDRAWALKTLGLSEPATQEDVKKAFRKAAIQYHPDKQINASEEEVARATEKFREICEAYEILC